jgi:hypothetical protein
MISVMTRSAFWFVFCFLALMGIGCAGPHLKSLTVDQVAARIAAHDSSTHIYDNNPKDVYDSGHLPGAEWVKYDAVTAADLPSDHGAMLIFYCASKA